MKILNAMLALNELTPKELEQEHRLLLQDFKPVDGYPLSSYYDVQMMGVMRTGDTQLRLQYNYGKHPLNGEPKVYGASQEDEALADLVLLKEHKKPKLAIHKSTETRTERVLRQRKEKEERDVILDTPIPVNVPTVKTTKPPFPEYKET